MTKFGKHPDKDTVDLAAEAAHGRARRRRRDDEGHGRPRRRQPHGRRRAAIGQALQKQIGQTGIPVYNVVQRVRDGRDRAAHRDHGGQGRRVRHGPRGRRREARRRRACSPAARAQGDADEWTPRGRYGAVAAVDGRIGTETMPGVFAQVGMEYGHKYGGTELRAVRPDQREEPLALDAQPARGLPRRR